LKDIAGRIAVVTGGGSGIGRATALALAEQGARVAVTDLRAASAEATAGMIRVRGGESRAYALDVADTAQIREGSGRIQEELGIPSLLVNNAGIAVGGYFMDTSEDSWQSIMSVNLMGVIQCCREFIPAMVGSGRTGHVVNIASMLGYTGMRGVTAYCTTKFGVMGFSESLRAEMVDHGIGVSAICPGMIRTNIIHAGILESSSEDVEVRRQQINALYEKRNYPPDKVARAVLSAIRRNRAVVPVTPEARFAYYLKRWLPGVVGWLARRDMV
jgi:NAD(P)-dependent dehydrogenase (short-subunit alcohol dehydrogenase family)